MTDDPPQAARRPHARAPDRRRRAHRPRAPQGRRPRARAVVLLRRAGLRADAAARQRGGLRVGRRLSPPHRAQHLGEPRRLAAAARHDRPLSPGDPLSRRARCWPMRCAACWPPASSSTAPATTASARRSTCATTTTTASSSTGTARASSGRSTPDGQLNMGRLRLDLREPAGGAVRRGNHRPRLCPIRLVRSSPGDFAICLRRLINPHPRLAFTLAFLAWPVFSHSRSARRSSPRYADTRPQDQLEGLRASLKARSRRKPSPG